MEAYETKRRSIERISERLNAASNHVTLNSLHTTSDLLRTVCASAVLRISMRRCNYPRNASRMVHQHSKSSRPLSAGSSVPQRAPKGVSVRYHNDTNAQIKPISSTTAAIGRALRLTRASWRAPFSCHRAHRSSKVRTFPTVSDGNWRAESPE